MDLQRAKSIFDYPDRLHRRLQIQRLFNSWKWVFRPAPTTSTHVDNEDTKSDVGSNSDAEAGNDTDSEGQHAESDSDSDDNDDGSHDFRSHIDAHSHTNPFPKFEAKYEIENWLKTDSPVLCISGKPGTGKTALIYYLEEERRTKEMLKLWHPEVYVLSHYFCNNRDDDILSNAEGFLRNLIYQTLSFQQKKEVQKVPIDEKDPSITWSVPDLESILFEILADCKVCLFADSINSNLLPLIQKLSRTPGWKVCFSTSPEVAQQEMNPLRIEEHTYDEFLQEARETLWRPLRDSGRNPKESTDTILRIVNHADGVYLLLQLAVYKKHAELVTKRDDLLDFIVPRTLSDFESQILGMKHATQASRYLNLVQNYWDLMEYSCSHFFNHYFYDLLGSDISVLEMTLVMRPELRKSVAEDLSEELTSRIENAMQEVKNDVVMHCSGLLQISNSRNELEALTQAMELMDGSPKHHNLIEALRTRVQLLPSAVPFLRDYGSAVMSLDKTPVQEWWHDIVETFLDLTEAGLISKAHVNRALVPLAKIESSDLLERCQGLYHQRKLRCLEGLDHRSTNLSPPFLALAAVGSSFLDFVLSHVESQATNVLRHIVDHVNELEENQNVLQFYYEPLCELGDPMEKGILALDFPTKPDQRFVVFESAIARILKHMIKYPRRVNKNWVPRFLQSIPDLEQRTSIAVNICTLAEESRRIHIEDAHYWQSRSFYRGSVTGITDVVYALEVDLAFLILVLQERLGMKTESRYYARLRAIQLRGPEGRKNYEFLHSDAMLVSQLMQCMVQDEVVFELTPETIRKITEDTSEEHYRASELLMSCFAESMAGYKLIEEELFQKMCKQIE